MISEQPITIDVGAGVVLDARLGVAQGARAGVVICHPHPLYGGDMDSGVVIAAAEACARRNIATLRFNFRGVGASTGHHDDGRGEQEDVRAALGDLRRRLPGIAVALAGYSFGAVVATAVAQKTGVAGLALIAPPLRITALPAPAAVLGPIAVIVGAEDQYCPPAALESLREALPQATVTVLEGADHFFFGSLDALAEVVDGWATAIGG